jgi:GH25 family lysozyme M1 (1,4-beta-N-acetylmuramidase)
MEVLKQGIDVSTHQGKIDWAKVKASGMVDFVFIRIGFRGYSNGIIKEDKWFKANIEGAIANGIEMIGGYFFTTALNAEEAKEEALWCAEKLAPYKEHVNLGVVFDLEGYGNPAYRSYGISKEQRTANYKAFSETLKKEGYSGLIYGSKAYVKSKFDIDDIKDYIWLAVYPKAPDKNNPPSIGKYDSRVAIWQYSSSGRVAGINAKVDLDYMYINPTSSQVTTVTEKVATVGLFYVRKGSTGAHVKTLQILLNAHGYRGKDGKPLTVDGNVGTNTIYAFTEYQKDHPECGKADGVCGVLGWKSLLGV